METLSKRLAEAIDKCCRTTTAPVGVKLAREGETPPAKSRYPQRAMGKRLAVCQGMTISRTLGWNMAFGKEDHACFFPAVFMGQMPPDEFLKGETATYYASSMECAQKMEAAYPRWPLDEYKEVWLSPLSRCEFEPDVAVVYGTPAQMVLLIQAANCSTGEGVSSFSFGRAGCVSWLVAAVQSGRCTYMVPGPGERIFAGTQDHEMSFAIPAPRFQEVMDGLEYVKKQGMFKYPVPNLAILGEPTFPEKYREMLPKD